MSDNTFDHIISGGGRLGAEGEGPQPQPQPQPQLGIDPAERTRSPS
jgi:hypothetical protein